MIAYALTSGDGIGWAIDEDLRLIRGALENAAHEVPVPFSRVLHAPFWMGLGAHHPAVLKHRFVVAHADNPPFFYLTQPEFARAQQTVDLWVARSTESVAQFKALDLPCTHIPYAIDEGLFFPIADKSALRAQLEIPQQRYVIGNFHRDSEGADLHCPKLQKAPELMVLICKTLLAEGAPIHVLLGGPRRHWIREALAREGVPFTFVGESGIAGDDLRENTLHRQKLNELYNACDLILIPSRWEGGPQSAMEASATKTKILSIPVGVARDILEPESFFNTAREAVSKIQADLETHMLDRTIEPQYERWKQAHSLDPLGTNLRRLYADLEKDIARDGSAFWNRASCHDLLRDTSWKVARRLSRKRQTPQVSLIHEPGTCAYLDAVVPDLRELLDRAALLSDAPNTGPVIAGAVANPAGLSGRVKFQLTGPDFDPDMAVSGAVLVAPSAQDAVNLRASGCCQPVLVCPLVLHGTPSTSLSPLVVEPGETRASAAILNAIDCGKPVIYPEESHYGFAIFHGGVAYGKSRSLAEALRISEEESSNLQSMANRPSEAGILRFFKAGLGNALWG